MNLMKPLKSKKLHKAYLRFCEGISEEKSPMNWGHPITVDLSQYEWDRCLEYAGYSLCYIKSHGKKLYSKIKSRVEIYKSDLDWYYFRKRIGT